MRYGFYIALFILASCKAQKSGHTSVGEPMEQLVLVDHDDYSNVEYFDTLIIRDTKSLRKFYTGVNKTRKPGLPVPMIDFSSDMAIIVCLGEQQGKYAPMLSKLSETDQELSLALELIQEEGQKDTTVEPVYFPFYLYKMPLVDKTVTFQFIEE
ncbi:hypothetical protein [Flagellimonas okinawensis]|uniref:Lipoprotein n=1 Tax=Flagellimonas okinawensis TaxID=3031324 RepID=A0ABT5XQZ6_9FLAO|nr:hypothetical protein [[Muricauda] okinawensis]MDF0708319.1 hypothetical protein [[Muricauda] okinawensis]